MKCQNLFSGKSKKAIISLLSAELAQRVLMVKLFFLFYDDEKKKIHKKTHLT